MRTQFKALVLGALVLTACGGGGSGPPVPGYRINAVVTGLTSVTGLSLQDNGSDTLTFSTSSTQAFATAVQRGLTYDVTILTQPAGHTCSVLNGSGTVTDATVFVTVACPWHVGYAPSSQGVLAYYIDQSTGATSALAENPFPAGANPAAIAISPAAGFLYVANQGDNTVSAFTTNLVDGSLSAIAGSPFAVGTTPVAIAIDPQGKFVYVANAGSNNLSAFTIDASTGALTPVTNSPFATGASPAGLMVSYLTVASGGFIYAAYGGSTQVSSAKAYIAAFTADPTTGVLSPVAGSPFTVSPPAGYQSTGAFAIQPQGNFLFVGFIGSFGMPVNGGVEIESIDSGTGALAPIAGSPFAASLAITSLIVDRTGAFLFAGNSDDAAIYGFAIDPTTGVLTAAGSYPAGTFPAVASIDPSNQYLYAPGVPGNAYPYAPGGSQGNANTSSPYSINATTGALTPFLNGTVSTIDNAAPVAFSTTP